MLPPSPRISVNVPLSPVHAPPRTTSYVPLNRSPVTVARMLIMASPAVTVAESGVSEQGPARLATGEARGVSVARRPLDVCPRCAMTDVTVPPTFWILRQRPVHWPGMSTTVCAVWVRGLADEPPHAWHSSAARRTEHESDRFARGAEQRGMCGIAREWGHASRVYDADG